MKQTVVGTSWNLMKVRMHPAQEEEVRPVQLLPHTSERSQQIRDRERMREAETYAEGEAGSLGGARFRTQSWDPGIMT